VDLQTSDPDAAKQFYGTLFGWEYDDMPMPQGGTYSMSTIRGKYTAAIAPLPPMQGAPPHWNSYIATSDVDATAKAVSENGGTVLMPPMDIVESGRMAFVADPTGAPVGFWQAKNHIGSAVVNEPGAFCWSELHTSDTDAASKFYGNVVGWQPEPYGDDYTVFNVGGTGIAGLSSMMMPGMPPSWLVYFEVADTDASAAQATDLGGTVLAPPMDIPAGRFAVLSDPQGAVFGIIKSAAM
jgi:predicted enzyme related to lactoylglutathione lyase